MNKTLRNALTALCAAILVASLLTGCSGGDSALYRWKASSAEKDAATFSTQLSAGERVNEVALFYTEKGKENINIHSFPAQAEGLIVDLAAQIKTKDLGAAYLSLIYAVRPGQELERLQVYVSRDGTCWSETAVGIRSTKIVGSGTDSAGNTVVYYEAHTENLLSLSEGEEIKGLRLAAQGTLALCELSVSGFASIADFEAAIPARTVPVSVLTPNEEAGRAALLNAVKNSTTEEDLGKTLEALSLAGITISESALELLDHAGAALVGGVTDEATDDVKMLFTYMYERDLMTEEKEAKLLAEYETIDNSAGVRRLNKPQQMFRGYAALQSGDLLLKASDRGADLYMVTGSKAVLQGDGVSLDPNESTVTYLSKGKEKTDTFLKLLSGVPSVPMTLSGLTEETGAEVDVSVTGGNGARVTVTSSVKLTASRITLGSVTAEVIGQGKMLVCSDTGLAEAVKALTDGKHTMTVEVTTGLGCTAVLTVNLEVVGGKISAQSLTTTSPAVEDNELPESDAEEIKSFKALIIGDQFSRSNTDYLYKVLEAEGYNDIALGYLYGKDATLADYIANMATDLTYTFGRNERDFWETATRYTVQRAVKDRDWDYIVLQTVPWDTTDFGEALKTMVSYVDIWKTNPDAKIGWHMNWGYQEDYENLMFSGTFGGNSDAMFAAIATAAEETALACDGIEFILPVGTAIMNIKSSFIEDVQVDANEVSVDGANLNEIGKLMAAYVWYATLTGTELKELKFDDIFLFNLSSGEKLAILDAVNNAVKMPFQVTPSAYPTEPEQYTAVITGGETKQYMPGDTVTLTAKELVSGQRPFQNWTATVGEVTFADPKSPTTTFTMPAQDVAIEPVYASDNAGQLLVGFGRADITPDYSMPLAGYGNTRSRMSRGTFSEDDRLNITAVAVSDGEHTNVIVTHDLIRSSRNWVKKAQEAVEAKTGLPADCLSISATHTHSAPDIGDLDIETGETSKQINSSHPYYELWLNSLVSAVEQALTDLSPVSQTKTSGTIVPGMNWVRHYRYSDGTMVGCNFDGIGGYNTGVTRDTDQELQLIRFVRENKKDVLMINWQGHPLLAGSASGEEGRMKISSDYCGVMYRYIEANDNDCLAAFYLGSSGNVMYTILTSHRERWNSPIDLQEYGTKMGRYVMEIMKNMDTVQTGAVTSLRHESVAVNRGYDSTRTIQQDVITIGSSIAFVTGGYEMFDTIGMDIKQASPYETTFVLTCSQSNGYMPNWQSCNYYLLGNTEAYEVRKAQFNEVPGTAEDLRDSIVAMLNILYQK